MTQERWSEFARKFIASVGINDFAERFAEDMQQLLVAKGMDYNDGTADRLQNFKSMAKLVGLTPAQVGMTLAAKHIDTIAAVVNGRKITTEPVRQRLLDAANYMVLIAAILEDEEKG